MLNQDVLNIWVPVYSFLKGFPLSLFAAGFAIYFGYMKVTNSIAFSYAVNYRDIGEKLINFILKNRRDKTYSIKKIICTLSDGNVMVLKEFQPPLLLKPFETTLIDFDDVSFWQNENGDIYKPEYFDKTFSIKVLLHGEGMVDCVRQYHSEYIKPTLHPSTYIFNGLTLTPSMKFVILVSINNCFENIVFYSYGSVEGGELFGGYNFLREEEVNVEAIVRIIDDKNFAKTWDYYTFYDVSSFHPRKIYDSRNLS